MQFFRNLPMGKSAWASSRLASTDLKSRCRSGLRANRLVCLFLSLFVFFTCLGVAADTPWIGLGPRFGVIIGDHAFSSTTETSWTVSEVPIRPLSPNRNNAGRINAIAINPADEREMFVASESGGVFKSVSGGTAWTHVDSLPVHDTRDVAYLPGDPGVIFVTDADVFRQICGAGIWRSEDGGTTWSQPAGTTFYDETSSPPGHSRCGGRPSGYGISIDGGTGRIYVATTCGILIGEDRGRRWRLKDNPGRGRDAEWIPAEFGGIAALGDRRIVTVGTTGVWWSSDAGENWQRAAGVPGLHPGFVNVGHHSASASPITGIDAFVVTERAGGGYDLRYTTDGGRHWPTVDDTPPGGGTCGGNPFIHVLRRSESSVDLYYGNDCELYHRQATRRCSPGSGCRLTYDGSWETFGNDHPDVRAVAFLGGRARFRADDGGLEKWNDLSSRFEFIGGDRGLNAWQLMTVAGQHVGPYQDIYVGSQDNGMRVSRDYGFSWPDRCGIEGALFQMERSVERESDSVIFWNDGTRRLGGPRCSDPRAWVGPPNITRDPEFATGEPLLLTRGTWVQPASHIEHGSRIWEVWLLNSEAGRPWRKVYSDPASQGFAYPASAGPASDPVVYYSLYKGGVTAAIYQLLRVSRFLEPASLAAHAEPAMRGCPAGSPGFGGLGTVPTMWPWYQVFAVDPGNAAHLIAPDAINGGMKKSTNGGECWEDMPELTRLVTRSGQLRFAPALDYGPGQKLFTPLVSAISFCPENPNYVILGTIEGGLFYSSDRGETWIELPNSTQVKPVTSFYWQSPTSIYVATYGRGLWHAAAISRSRVSLGDLETFEWCPQPCFKQPYLPPPDPRPLDFDSAFFVYDGAISDARAENNTLASVAVTPGAIGFHFESEQAKRLSLPIRFAPQTGQFAGLPEVQKLVASGRIIRGFTFRQGVIRDIIYGPTVAHLNVPKPQSSVFQPSGGQIVPKGPRVDLLAGTIQGFYPVLFGGGEIKILGNNFRGMANKPIQIQVDGQVISRNVLVDSKGSFKISIKVNRPEGWHTLTAIQRVDPNHVIQSSNLFIVRHLDKK